jgi:formylglycine-generating enzyme required for sulfatase activity
MKKTAGMGRTVGCALVWFAATTAGLGAPPVETRPAASGALAPEPRPLAAVFDVARPRQSDLVLLANGDQVAGTLLNETLSLATAIGRLELDTRVVAGVELSDGGGSLDSLVTVNNNRLSGFLEDSVFVLERPAHGRVEVRRERVVKVVFQVREGELRGMPQGRWIRLRNGDWLSGQLLADPLPLLTEHTQVPVSLKDAASLAFAPGKRPLAAITLRNGQTLRGTLEGEDLPVQLDFGPKILLHQSRIDVIADERAAAAPPPGRAPPANAAAAGESRTPSFGQTNVAGMVWIPPGQFVMGSPNDEVGRDQDEGPETKVKITQGFWMGKCEVTQAEYKAVMGSNPSIFTGDTNRPVEKVSWQEAMDYCARLTQRAQAAGQLPEGWLYRLPTEAEWEYACRAGASTRFCYGDDTHYTQLGEYAWFMDNSDAETHPVGKKRPNAWGLHDMHGNVWEWCLSRWESSLPGGSITDLVVRAEGGLRVARGGSWLYDGRACRSANRDEYSPSNRCSDVGFRVVLAPAGP